MEDQKNVIPKKNKYFEKTFESFDFRQTKQALAHLVLIEIGEIPAHTYKENYYRIKPKLEDLEEEDSCRPFWHCRKDSDRQKGLLIRNGFSNSFLWSFKRIAPYGSKDLGEGALGRLTNLDKIGKLKKDHSKLKFTNGRYTVSDIQNSNDLLDDQYEYHYENQLDYRDNYSGKYQSKYKSSTYFNEKRDPGVFNNHQRGYRGGPKVGNCSYQSKENLNKYNPPLNNNNKQLQCVVIIFIVVK